MQPTNNKSNKKNPFTVPNGYFERFHEEMMQKLPLHKSIELTPTREEKKRDEKLWFRVKRLSYAAIILFALILSGQSYYNSLQPKDPSTIAQSEQLDEKFIEDILDNYPIDEFTLYSYLTNTETSYE